MKVLKFILMFFLTGFLSLNFAQSSGKITGHIYDDTTGEPLIGVNIILEGTSIGAATDVEGYYVMLNVPPGEYTIKVSYIGYTTYRGVGTRVNIDQTTNLDVRLKSQDIGLEEIVVQATQPVVQRDVSASLANITAEEIQALPSVDINRSIGLQAGILSTDAGPVIRGGSARETAYIVNGISLRDERDNTPYTKLSMTSVDDIQVQTGGFNAEYGNIRSGIIKVVTKEGSKDKYTFSLVSRFSPANPKSFGGYANDFNSYWIRPYIDNAVAWTGTQNGAWDPYTALQYPQFEGWISVAEKTLRDDDPTNDLTPEAAQRLFLWEHRKVVGIEKPDYDLDLSLGGPVPVVGKYLGDLRFFASYRKSREMYMIPLSTDSYQDYTSSIKLTSDISKELKLMVEGLYGEEWGTNSNNAGLPGIFRSPSSIASQLNRVSYIDSRIFSSDYWAPTNTIRNNVGMKFTYVPSASTFLEVIFSRFSSDYSTNPGRLRDSTKIMTFGNAYSVDEAPFGWQPNPSTGITGLRMGVGMSNSRDSSFVAVYTMKSDIVSQVDKYNQIKAGFEVIVTDNETNYGSVDAFLQSGRSQSKWKTTPVRAGLYIQDKLEFEGMVANVGLRVDYLDPGGEWYVYDPYTPYFSSKFSLGIDSLLPKEATEKQLTFSPRVGIAFPISVNSKLYFNYGHQRSIPTPENLYLVRRFTDNNAITRLADPNIPLEKTIQYELGYEHSLFDEYLIRVAGYYKDISFQPLLVSFQNRDNSVNYSVSEPNSYADIRGFELTLSKNRGQWVRGFINYTYDVTTSGRFGFLNYNENPAIQRQYERESTDAYQEKPVPRPYARGNVYFFTPTDFGPDFMGLAPLADWQLNIIAEWRNGYYFTWTGGGSVPGIINNVQWNDFWNVDLRLSKRFNIADVLSLDLFVDMTNVFNFKYMTGYGYFDGKDYESYMKSLHLPDEIGKSLQYVNIPGDDKPGDYRISGGYQPVIGVANVSSIVAPVPSAIYYDASQSAFLQFQTDSGTWSQVDKSKMDQIIENKQYIDMPNQDFLTFLNPRNIYFGLKLSLELF